MSWIKMIEEKEADGKLKKLYDKIMNPENNKVANILKVHSLNSEVLEAHLKLYKTIMFGKSKISRRQREMIAVVVSGINSCHY